MYNSSTQKRAICHKAPTDTNECAQAVGIWIARLNVIKSGLASFLMSVDGGGISTTMESLTIAPPRDGTTQAQPGFRMVRPVKS